MNEFNDLTSNDNALTTTIPMIDDTLVTDSTSKGIDSPSVSISTPCALLGNEKSLYQAHYDECLRRGLKPEHIAKLVANGTLRSFTIDYRNKLPNFEVLRAGETIGDVLIMKFGETFVQIKPDKTFYDVKGKRLKYLSASGIKSEAWIPEDFLSHQGLKVITEGFFDASIGTYLGGIPTAALAGVNNYLKTIGSGMKKIVILFDADARSNHGVISALYVAGKRSGNKIQIIPPIKGEPKAGLEEYFKAGNTAQDYKALIEAAMTPLDFLYSVLDGDLPQDARKFRIVKQVCKLVTEHEPYDEARAFIAKAYKKCGVRLELQQVVDKQLKALSALLAKKKEKAKKQAELTAPILKKDSSIYREAEALLDAGEFFNIVNDWIAKTNVLGLNHHIILDLIGSAGIITGKLKRALCVKYIGKTGTGKSLAQNIKAHLMPVGSVIKINMFTVAVLKRKGSAWKNKQLIVDEMTSLMQDEGMRNILKSLISEGELKVEVTEPTDGKHNIIELNVEGVITISTCSVEHTQALTLGGAEDEMTDRFLDIPMPTNKEYVKAINTAPLNEKEDTDIELIDLPTVELIRAMIQIAMERPAPTIEPTLREALQSDITDSIEIARIIKQLKALMLNCAALSGKAQADYETYAYIYPLASISAQTKASPKNGKTYEAYKKLTAQLKVDNPGQALFGMGVGLSDIKTALSVKSKDAAYTHLNNFKDSKWIDTDKGHHTITNQGAMADRTLPNFEDIIPRPDVIAGIIQKVRKNSGKIPVFSKGTSEGCNADTVCIVEDNNKIIPVIPVVKGECVQNKLSDAFKPKVTNSPADVPASVEEEEINNAHTFPESTGIPEYLPQESLQPIDTRQPSALEKTGILPEFYRNSDRNNLEVGMAVPEPVQAQVVESQRMAGDELEKAAMNYIKGDKKAKTTPKEPGSIIPTFDRNPANKNIGTIVYTILENHDSYQKELKVIGIEGSDDDDNATYELREVRSGKVFWLYRNAVQAIKPDDKRVKTALQKLKIFLKPEVESFAAGDTVFLRNSSHYQYGEAFTVVVADETPDGVPMVTLTKASDKAQHYFMQDEITKEKPTLELQPQERE